MNKNNEQLIWNKMIFLETINIDIKTKEVWGWKHHEFFHAGQILWKNIFLGDVLRKWTKYLPFKTAKSKIASYDAVVENIEPDSCYLFCILNNDSMLRGWMTSNIIILIQYRDIYSLGFQQCSWRVMLLLTVSYGILPWHIYYVI